MSEAINIKQLKKYAEDLKKTTEEEKARRVELKNANIQNRKYAEDLNKTIGELKKANRKLKRQVEIEETEKLLQKKMIHINKMTSLGTLAAGIAHEINNPISYILGNSQILQELWEEIEKILSEVSENQDNFALRGIPFNEISEMIPKILKNNIEGARQISLITGKLKNLSRQEETVSSSRININQAIDYTIAILDRQIKQNTTRFMVKLKKNLPLAIGNTHEIEQVLINIIQNALQALPDKASGIIITSDYSPKTGKISVKIKDEGEGMSEEIRERIMEPFFTTRADSEGTGLGLYISYAIIQKTGGHIDVHSEPGNGTEVTIHLPAKIQGDGP